MNKRLLPCIPVDEPHQQLSEYNIFQGKLSELDPVKGIIPYDLRTPLFTDYAQKLRMIYIPEGSSVNYTQQAMMNYPVGTVLIKNFFYDLDQTNSSADRKLIETRLLLHQEKGWRAETYIWNEKQSEAQLKTTGQQVAVTWTDQQGTRRKVEYLIPTKNDCKACHSADGKLLPLGPRVNNLNQTYQYYDGPKNQLKRWERLGLLKGKPDTEMIPKAPIWNDSSTGTLNERARMYLDVNCGHCHNPAGSASNSALFLNYEQEESYQLGICKPPVAPGSGSGGLRHDIWPCEPDKSILVYRMEATEPEKRMPEIGRTLVHEEAVKLIRDWIENMECTTCENFD